MTYWKSSSLASSSSRASDMKTRQSIETVLRAHRARLAANYGIKRLGLFGSYVKGVPNLESDVDIIVEFEKPLGLKFIQLADELEDLLGQKVDILTPEGLRGIRIHHVANDIAQSIVYV